jgi:hypothetical protein
VQAWAWYSLYDGYYGGDLVYPDAPRTLTLAGTQFAQIVAAQFVPYVDLYPVWMDASSVVVDKGDVVTLTVAAQVDNHGNAMIQSVPAQYAQRNSSTGEMLSASMITVSQVFTRYSGAQPVARHQMQVVPGELYTLTFEIDPMRAISQSLRSAQRRDLAWRLERVIASLALDRPTVFEWQGLITTTVTTTIRNVSSITSAAAHLQLGATFQDGTTYWGERLAVPPLPPHATLNVSGRQFIPAPGFYTVTSDLQLANPYTAVQSIARSFELRAGAPDLALASVDSVLPNVFYWERPVSATLTATVRNLGYVTSTLSVLQFSASVSGSAPYQGPASSIPPLAPGASAEVTGDVALPAWGVYVITGTLQPGGPDEDARNHFLTRTLLATAPDLAVSLAANESVVYYEGAPVTQTLTATVRNLGRVAARPAQIEWSAALTQPVMALAPDASAELTRAWAITAPGWHVITATVRYDHVELDAHNNAAAFTLWAVSHRAYLPMALRASP